MTMPNVLYNGPGNWPDADKLMANYNYLENIATAYTTLRNRIINGDMRIDQRNEGAAVTVNAGGDIFSVDRWHGLGQPTDGAFTLQRVTTVPTGFVNALKATVTAADASIGASQIYGIRQKIEGSNIVDFCLGNTNSKYMTLSFWVQASTAGVYGGAIFNSDASRTYPFAFTINSANTYEYKTITIPCDTTGNWLKDTGIGLQLMFSFGTGSSLLGSPFGWTSGSLYGATGQTNLISTNGSTFYITGVQLEIGSIATSFELLPISTQLQLCQRYYEKSLGLGTKPGSAYSGQLFNGTVSGTAIGGNIASFRYCVDKRNVPTTSIFDNQGNSAKVTTWTGGTTTDNVSPTNSAWSVTEKVHMIYHVGSVAGIQWNATADAEL